uniref:MHD domain-containing protein n=1 Tax=Ascaris lumbricoides TaxID=6252 RepID=A0A0M3HQL6_ASCLU
MSAASEPSGSLSPNEISEDSVRQSEGRNDDESSSGIEKGCSQCRAMRASTLQAYHRKQLEKVSRDQGILIDNFRNQLKKTESERNKLLADFEQMKEAVQKASEYQDRFAETLAALKAEHEAREELVRKYSKMADYAEAYEIQVKKLETELSRLKETCSSHEANIALYTHHTPSVLKLMFELADIAEANSLMNQSQGRRVVYYRSNFGLREALMRKGRLKKPATVSISTVEDSEDDELAESVENILSRDQFEDEEDVRVNMFDRKEEKTKAVAEVEQKSRVAFEKEKQAEKNPEKERDDLTAEVSTSFQDKRRRNVTQSETTGNEGKRQSRRGKRTMDTPLHENAFAEHLARKLAHSESSSDYSDVQHKSIHGKKSKPLWMIQNEMIEKKKKEVENRKKTAAAESLKLLEEDVGSSSDEPSRNAEICEMQGGEIDEFICRCTSHLSIWSQFANVEPLLEVPSKPAAPDEPMKSPKLVPSASTNDLSTSPHRSFNDRLGLSLSPSVSSESVTTSTTSLTPSRRHMVSESLSIDDAPSGSSLGASARSKTKVSSRSRTCSYSRQSSANQDAKERVRSISITTVSSCEYRKLPSWNTRECSFISTDQHLITKNVSRRNQRIERVAAAYNQLPSIRTRRMTSCEGSDQRVEWKSARRRTVSCSIDRFADSILSNQMMEGTQSKATDASERQQLDSYSAGSVSALPHVLSHAHSRISEKKLPSSDDFKQWQLPPLLDPVEKLVGKKEAICDVQPTVDLVPEKEASSSVTSEEPTDLQVVCAETKESLETVGREHDSTVVQSKIAVEGSANETVKDDEREIRVATGDIKERGEGAEEGVKSPSKVCELPTETAPETQIDETYPQQAKLATTAIKGKPSQRGKGRPKLMRSTLENTKETIQPEGEVKETTEQQGLEVALASNQSTQPDVAITTDLNSFMKRSLRTMRRSTVSKRTEEQLPREIKQLRHSTVMPSEPPESHNEGECLKSPVNAVIATEKMTRVTRSTTKRNNERDKLTSRSSDKQKKDLAEATHSVKKQIRNKNKNLDVDEDEHSSAESMTAEVTKGDKTEAKEDKNNQIGEQENARTSQAQIPTVSESSSSTADASIDERELKTDAMQPHVKTTTTSIEEDSDEENALRIVVDDDAVSGMPAKEIAPTILPFVSDSEGDEEGDVLRIEDSDTSENTMAAKKETPLRVSCVPRTVSLSSRPGSGAMYKKVRKFLPTYATGLVSQSRTAAMQKRKKIEHESTEMKPMKIARRGSTESVTRKSIGRTVLLPTPLTNKSASSKMPNVSRSVTQLAESAVMTLLDEAIAGRSTLPILVKKFREPPVNELDTNCVVACVLKLINTMEVGNMWPSMLAASRHGVVEQVASMKERSLFELINQIGAESQWNDISEKLFMRLATLLQKMEAASISQHGRDFRCMLIAGRIATEVKRFLFFSLLY